MDLKENELFLLSGTICYGIQVSIFSHIIISSFLHFRFERNI